MRRFSAAAVFMEVRALLHDELEGHLDLLRVVAPVDEARDVPVRPVAAALELLDHLLEAEEHLRGVVVFRQGAVARVQRLGGLEVGQRLGVAAPLGEEAAEVAAVARGGRVERHGGLVRRLGLAELVEAEVGVADVGVVLGVGRVRVDGFAEPGQGLAHARDLGGVVAHVGPLVALVRQPHAVLLRVGREAPRAVGRVGRTLVGRRGGRRRGEGEADEQPGHACGLFQPTRCPSRLHRQATTGKCSS